MKWEVNINYVGSNSYLIEASTPDEAKEKATQRYMDGDNGETLQIEEETIKDIKVKII